MKTDKSKHRFSQLIFHRAAAVFCCVIIIAFGIVFFTKADPVTTTIGQNISTNNLSLSGNVTSGTWQGTAIDTTHGGTGQDWSAATQGSLPYFSGTGALSALTPGTAGQFLQSGGVGANPSWTSKNFQETASYIIYTDGTNVYAKNGSTGSLDYSGTDFSTVLQSVSNQLTTGGTIFIKGSYSMNAQVTFSPGVMIYGDGSTGIDISNLNDTAFYFNKNGSLSTYKITGIQKLSIGGNVLKTNSRAMAFDRIYEGITVQDVKVLNTNFLILNGECSGASINRVYVYNPTTTGIVLENTSGGWGPTDTVLDHITMEHGPSGSVAISDLSGTIMITHSYIENFPIAIMTNKNDGATKIDNTHFGLSNAGDVVWDIYHTNGFTSSISNSEIDVNVDASIIHDRTAGEPIVFQNNDVFTSCYMGGTRALFQCEATSSIKVDGNQFTGTGNAVIFNAIGGISKGSFRYNRQMVGVIVFNIGAYAFANFDIIGNELYNASYFMNMAAVNMRDNYIESKTTNLYISTSGVAQNNIINNVLKVSGGHSYQFSFHNQDYFSKNQGYLTENSNTSTLTAGQTSVTVTHGLATTPTRVQLTPTTDTGGKRYWISAKGVTTFTITIDSANASDITFDWRAVVGEGN